MKNPLKSFVQFVFVALLFTACNKNDDAPEPLALEIGQEYQGGIIIYLDATGTHGFIAYQSDLGKAPWGCFTQPNPVPPTVPIAQNEGIGFGEQNTLAIVNFCADPYSAARLAYELEANGYDDWFLPSIEELMLVYQNREAIGGFPDLNNSPNDPEVIVYASSSEGWATNDINLGPMYLNYQVYDFSNITALPNTRRLYTGKDTPVRVRPIRSF